MSYILYLFCLALVAVAIGGIMLFLHDHMHIEAPFLPILAVSLITVTAYLGGLIGVLAPVTILIYIAGAGMAVYEGIRILQKKYSPKEFFMSPAIWAFVLFCICFVVRMRGMQVLHVDNFSHWATIIKEMCQTDGFPAEGTIISYRNYTPGSATFIYFVCKVVSFTEGHALMAQGIITSAALATLFCRIRWRNAGGLFSLLAISAVAICILELLSASLGIYNFLVDDLLAFVTVAAGVIVYAHRKDIKKCLMILIPVIGMLVLIKSSARIFAALVTVMFVAAFIKVLFRPKNLLGAAALIGVQFLLPTFYNMYIRHTFPEHIDKFSSDMGGLLSTFTSKEPGYLQDIASKMLAEMSDLSSTSVQLILLAEVVAAGVCLLCLALRHVPRAVLRVFVCTTLTMLFYIGELFVLYGFIFVKAEATVLASFYRYFATGTILVVIPLLTAAVYQLQQLAERYEGKRILATALSGVMVLFSLMSLYTVRESAVQLLLPHCRKSTAARERDRTYYNNFYSVVAEELPEEGSVLVYTENTTFFAASMPEYQLMRDPCSTMKPKDFRRPKTVRKRLKDWDYIVVSGNTQQFIEHMESAKYEVLGGEALIYKISSDTQTLIAVDGNAP